MRVNFEIAANSIKDTSNHLRANSVVLKENVKAFKDYAPVLAESGGVATETFRKVKQTIEEVTRTAGQAKQTLSDALNLDKFFATKRYEEWVNSVRSAFQSLSNFFSNVFFNVITGGFKNLKEVAADFGRSILQMLTQLLAKILVLKLLTAMAGPGGKILGVGIDKLFHAGGIVRAHGGYLARDEVPIIAQSGEGIVSRRGMQTLGAANLFRLNRGESLSGSQTIQPTIIIKAWDATDITRHQKDIENIIVNSLARNGVVSGAMKKYG
jgi:hypothetical protein